MINFFVFVLLRFYYVALKSGHIRHCTDDTRKVETVALSAVVLLVLLPIVRSISDKMAKRTRTDFLIRTLRQV